MNILKRMFSFFDKKLITVVEDPRTDKERSLDWSATKSQAFVSAASRAEKGTLDLWGFDMIEESPLADENQYNTSSCVAHAVGTATEDLGQNRPSQLLFYRTRSNYPGAGCIPHEMVHRASKYFLPDWDLFPTPVGATERLANALPLVNLKKRPKGKELPYYDVLNNKYDNGNAIAAASYLGCRVMATIFAATKEWRQKFVNVIDPNLVKEDAGVRHEIYVLPRSGFTHCGVKYVAVVDSAHFGGYKIRYVSKEFLDKRVYTAYAFIKR